MVTELLRNTADALDALGLGLAAGLVRVVAFITNVAGL